MAANPKPQAPSPSHSPSLSHSPSRIDLAPTHNQFNYFGYGSTLAELQCISPRAIRTPRVVSPSLPPQTSLVIGCTSRERERGGSIKPISASRKTRLGSKTSAKICATESQKFQQRTLVVVRGRDGGRGREQRQVRSPKPKNSQVSVSLWN